MRLSSGNLESRHTSQSKKTSGQQWVKRLSVNLSLAGAGLIITLLFIEAALRLVYPAHERDWVATHQPDEDLGWAYIPGSSQWYTSPGEFRTYFEVNANGQRDVDRTYEKPADTYRIIMLGDSFVASLQTPLEQSFVNITEDHLSRLKFQPDARIEVLNVGTGGYGTDQELRWFRKKGIQYAPDVVVLVVFLGNDIADNDFELWYLAGSQVPSKPFFKVVDGQLKDVGRMGTSTALSGDHEISLLRVRRFLQRHSHTYALASAALVHLEGQPAFQKALNVLGQGGGTETYNHSYDLFAKLPLPAWERAWTLTELLILTMKEEVETSGAEFRVVLIPHPVQVQQDWWAARLSLYPVMAHMEWDLWAPNTRLGQFLEANQISYLDLLPLLLDYVDRTGNYIYYRSDGHFTVKGSQVVGEAIAEWLNQTLN